MSRCHLIAPRHQRQGDVRRGKSEEEMLTAFHEQGQYREEGDCGQQRTATSGPPELVAAP